MPLIASGSLSHGDLARSFAQLMRDDTVSSVLVFDRDQRLAGASPNASRLLGLEIEPLIGAEASALPPRLRKLVKDAAHSRKSGCETEFLERAGKAPQNLRLTALPLGGAGPGAGVAVLVQDLSHARRIEDDLRQLDRLAGVGTLAAEMAHEVKNALVAVKTFADLLLEKNSDAELAETVRRELKRIDSIVGQVLHYSRHASPAFKSVSVHTLIERCFKATKPQFEGRNVTVVSRFAASPDIVLGDEDRLEQSILNLLFNAMEAMDGDGTLTVETDTVSDHGAEAGGTAAPAQVQITIRDTGAGIASENISHLFEPFFTTKKHGTGLGLAITRRIVHEHRGVISAESEAGKGASFRIRLPAA